MKLLEIAFSKCPFFFFIGILVSMNCILAEPGWSQDTGFDVSQLPPEEMLEYGMQQGSLQTIEQAISKGAQINGKAPVPLCAAIDEANRAAELGGSPTSRATFMAIVRWLLQNGADPNLLPNDDRYNPPLFKAVEFRDLETVTLLLDGYKANPNLRNQNGDTALHVLAGAPIALSYPYEKGPEIARLLISRGAKSLKNDEGLTPLALAREMLRLIENSDTWAAMPFYESLVQSYKSLIEITAKL